MFWKKIEEEVRRLRKVVILAGIYYGRSVTHHPETVAHRRTSEAD